MIYHVHTDADGGWVVRREYRVRARVHFWTKRKAVEYAKAQKGWTEIVVHRTDGTVMNLLHPKPVVAPIPKLARATLAGRMVKRFANARA